MALVSPFLGRVHDWSFQPHPTQRFLVSLVTGPPAPVCLSSGFRENAPSRPRNGKEVAPRYRGGVAPTTTAVLGARSERWVPPGH